MQFFSIYELHVKLFRYADNWFAAACARFIGLPTAVAYKQYYSVELLYWRFRYPDLYASDEYKKIFLWF